jgi:hypothetical protein
MLLLKVIKLDKYLNATSKYANQNIKKLGGMDEAKYQKSTLLGFQAKQVSNTG